MDIIVSVLERYFEKNGCPVIVKVNLSYKGTLTFLRGRDNNGSLEVLLDVNDLQEILDINGITGEIGLLRKELDAPYSSGSDKRREEYIYDTLSKYIIDMLHAATRHIAFPEIKHLKRHITMYFDK